MEQSREQTDFPFSFPEQREPLQFEATFTQREAESIKRGLRAPDMEDKWIVQYTDGWLRFHRSWTKALIYWLKLTESAEGVRVTESWVNRNPEQYKDSDTAYDQRLVRFIIDALLLGKFVPFPLPKDAHEHPPGVMQHSLVGRGYPEEPYEEHIGRSTT